MRVDEKWPLTQASIFKPLQLTAARLFFLFWHHHAVFCICPSTRARTFPPMCTRKGCVNGMNKPDSPPALAFPPPRTRPPFLATGSTISTHQPSPAQRSARQLRRTREQELLSASQDDRVTLSRHRGCVNVWFGMWDGAVEDTGSGPGTAVLRKVTLRSERAQQKLRQNPFFLQKAAGKC